MSGMKANDTSSLVAIRIRQIREALGWTVGDLAERSGLSRDVMSDIENGRTRGHATRTRRRAVTVDELMLIAGALEVPPGSLLPDSPPARHAGELDERRQREERVTALEAELAGIRRGLRRLLKGIEAPEVTE